MRAIAILSVLIFHAFPARLQSGFIGVDVFFVLSGFLITTIILKGLERENFSFREFYAHRTKRIFPALIVVLTACYAVGWFKLLPIDFKPLGMHIASGAAFVQNFVLWREAGYFDTASELKPLMHLWSLAIEEQFYIAYPLAVYLCWRTRVNTLTAVGTVAVLSFIANIATVGHHPIAAFFLPQTRIWELMAGGILAHVMLHHRQRMWDVATTVFVRKVQSQTHDDDNVQLAMTCVSVLGAIILVIGFATITPATAFPGWWALAPVVGTVLLLAAGPTAWINRTILSHDVMVFVGKISYPLYLWHWPIFSILRVVEGDQPSRWIRVGAMAASVALAYGTYVLIEKPVRYGRATRYKTPMIVALLIVVAYFGYDAYRRDGLPFRPISRQFQEYSKITNVYDYFRYSDNLRGKICHAVPFKDAVANGCVAPASEKSIMIWGDSYAAALYPGVRDAVTQRHPDYAITQITAGNAPPFNGVAITDSGESLTHENEDRLKALAMSKPSIVLITWMVEGQNAIQDMDAAVASLAKTVDSIKATSPKSRIVVVGPVPEWKPTLLKKILEYANAQGRLPPRYMAQGLNLQIPKWDAWLSQKLPALGVTYVSAVDAMCDSDGCLTRLSDDPKEMTAVDWGHLTAPAAKYLMKKIDAQVFGR